MLRDLFSLFPAHAGVIPEYTTPVTTAPAFPRTCGGDPARERKKPPGAAAFPRTCGGDPYTAKPADYIVPFSPHTRG